ncbi:MAG: Gfo/Idh/MocA family oxidoreductase, partial [Phycisphaerales bacterium]|nr:Gfo/Idh/MocA family oxidoreductase [Phycisphaerales bacterium]
MTHTLLTRLLILLSVLCVHTTALVGADDEPIEPLRLAVIGLDHGHVEGVLWNAMNRDDLAIVGIYDPNPALFEKYRDKYHLDPAWFSTDLGAMLDATRPEAASVMTPISDHLEVVQACAPRGVHTLLEKPLAFDLDDARVMAHLAKEHGVLVLTNFETSWYASVRTAQAIVDSDDNLDITRVVFRHGHKGPKEIGCSEEFLEWLTDPEKNGGGAIVDFG